VDALDVLKVCLRRWFIMLPILALALGAGYGLASQQKPTYTAVANYALVFQGTVTDLRDPRTANPLAANGGLLLGEALLAELMSIDAQAKYGNGNSGVAPGEADLGTAYTVSRPDNAQSYVVQTWGQDPEAVRATVDAVLASAPVRAVEIQERVGAPKRSQLTAFVTLPTQVSMLPPTATLKLMIALGGVGLLAGAALSLVVDRIMTRRKQRGRRLPPPIRWEGIPADEPTPPQTALPAFASVEATGTEPVVQPTAPLDDDQLRTPVAAAEPVTAATAPGRTMSTTPEPAPVPAAAAPAPTTAPAPTVRTSAAPATMAQLGLDAVGPVTSPAAATPRASASPRPSVETPVWPNGSFWDQDSSTLFSRELATRVSGVGNGHGHGGRDHGHGNGNGNGHHGPGEGGRSPEPESDPAASTEHKDTQG
jgi:hypothetical protein